MLKKTLIYLPVLLLLGYNASFFILKNAQAITGKTERDAAPIKTFIKKHIPTGSKVIGEPLFFYAVQQNGSDFQYLNLYEDLDVREAFHRQDYDYDYIIVSDHLKMRDYKGCIDYYLSKADFIKVATRQHEQAPWTKIISEFSIGNFSLLSNVEKHGYNCTIYKRLKAKE